MAAVVVVVAALARSRRLVTVVTVVRVVQVAWVVAWVVRAAMRGLCSVSVRPVVRVGRAVRVSVVLVAPVVRRVGMEMVGPAVWVALVPGVVLAVMVVRAVCSWVPVARVAPVGMPPMWLVMVVMVVVVAIRACCRGVLVAMVVAAARAASLVWVVMGVWVVARD